MPVSTGITAAISAISARLAPPPLNPDPVVPGGLLVHSRPRNPQLRALLPTLDAASADALLLTARFAIGTADAVQEVTLLPRTVRHSSPHPADMANGIVV
jgi:hypothetical protein